MDNNLVSEKELQELIKERGSSVLERFRQFYSVNNGNKELKCILDDVKKLWNDNYRPALVSLACEAVGGKPEDTIDVSLMLAFGGAGISVHDDIIDKSLLKKEHKTILGLHNIDNALLVGDLLIIKGLTKIQDIIAKGYQPKKVIEILDTLQNYYFEICEGVFMEKAIGKNLEIDLTLFERFLWKYTSDGGACTKLGAIIGNGDREEVEELAKYGRCLCYIDRLCGEVKDSLNIRNNRGRLEFESVPLPVLYAAKFSKQNYSKIQSILDGPISPSENKTLIRLCEKSNAFIYVKTIAEKYKKEGISALSTLKKSRARSFLIMLINNMYKNFLGINPRN